MRYFICFVFIGLVGCASFVRRDPLKSQTLKAPVERQVSIPGVDTPASGPGMAAQMPINTAPVTQPGEKEPKILPPSDSRSFGISVPIGKTKKDTLR